MLLIAVNLCRYLKSHTTFLLSDPPIVASFICLFLLALSNVKPQLSKYYSLFFASMGYNVAHFGYINSPGKASYGDP